MHCRFCNKNITYHTCSYSRKGLSASFYAVLYNETFVKIDYIISKGDRIDILCTDMVKKNNFVDQLFHDDNDLDVLQALWPTLIVDFGERIVPAENFERHLVIIELDGVLYATPVSYDFEVYSRG